MSTCLMNHQIGNSETVCQNGFRLIRKDKGEKGVCKLSSYAASGEDSGTLSQNYNKKTFCAWFLRLCE